MLCAKDSVRRGVGRRALFRYVAHGSGRRVMGQGDDRGSPHTPDPGTTQQHSGTFGTSDRSHVPDRDDASNTGHIGQREPPQSDVLERMPGIEPPAVSSGMRFPGAQSDVLTPAGIGGRLRLVVREFLESVPRAEAQASIALLRPDATTRVFTRGEFSAAIDAMRPRMRQIMRLAVEERWQRQRVCDYLNNISIKTFERDHAEAFDELMAFVLGR
jgi:hypothetical protein